MGGGEGGFFKRKSIYLYGAVLLPLQTPVEHFLDFKEEN